MKLLASAIAGLAVVGLPLASASPAPRTDVKLPLPQRLLHDWANGSWVENISVRPNGNLLVSTSTPDGSVWQIKEPWKDKPEVELVYNFDQWVDRLIGIGETTPDKYVVVGSRFYSTDPMSSHVDRTFAAMELDFSGSANKDKPAVRLIAWFPDAHLLQGVAALPWDRTKVLISDQYLLRPRAAPQKDWTPARGQVWKLDTVTGAHEVVFANDTALDTTYRHGYDVGINGIKIRRDWLYWVNSDDGNIYRLKIDKTGRPVPPAKPEVVAFQDTIWDDFNFGPEHEDTIWATGFNAIFAASPQGKVVTVNGVGTSDNGIMPGPTACAFGRSPHDRNILYVTGNMGEIPVDIEHVHLKGWVRAIDTTGFHF